VAIASPSNSRSKLPGGKNDENDAEGRDAEASGPDGEAPDRRAPKGLSEKQGQQGRFDPRRVSTLTWAVLGGVAAGAWAKLGMGMGLGPPLVMTGLGGFTLVLAAAALWRVVDPLTRAEGRAPVDLRAPHRIRELEREKQAVLKAIKEIELDYQMRKISEPDYREMIERYRARALRILGDLAAGNDYRVLIERELKGRLSAMGRVSAAAAATAAEVNLAEAPTAAARMPVPAGAVAAAPLATGQRPSATPPGQDEPRPIRCAGCQTVNDLDAQFCKRCGKNLLSPASSVPA
jgi:rRNA maturation endonuclease Nob1